MSRTTEKKYSIIKDRVEIYGDFALNLLYYINKYYIDRETLSLDEDIHNHFNWCYKKVCNEFLEEGIDFTKNEELIEYYYAYYYHQFYTASNNQDISLGHFEKFWKNIFIIDNQKNRNIINVLIDIYGIHDKSINVENNKLEII